MFYFIKIFGVIKSNSHSNIDLHEVWFCLDKQLNFCSLKA